MDNSNADKYWHAISVHGHFANSQRQTILNLYPPLIVNEGQPKSTKSASKWWTMKKTKQVHVKALSKVK